MATAEVVTAEQVTARPGDRDLLVPLVRDGGRAGRADQTRASASTRSSTLGLVSQWCLAHDIVPESLELGRRNLEDVFLEKTGLVT